MSYIPSFPKKHYLYVVICPIHLDARNPRLMHAFPHQNVADGRNRPLRRREHGAVSVLQNSAHLLNRRRGGDLAAGDGALGVDLAGLPVGVLPGGVAAGQVELDAALGREAAALVGAVPRLVDGEAVGGPRKGEGSLVGGGGGGHLAVVDKVAVEEVGQLVRGRAADGRVAERRVAQREVDVAPRVLVGGRREGVRGMEVEVVDSPLGDLCRAGGASRGGGGWRRGVGGVGISRNNARGQGQSRAGEEESGQEAQHGGGGGGGG